jgi:hypothetical protein
MEIFNFFVSVPLLLGHPVEYRFQLAVKLISMEFILVVFVIFFDLILDLNNIKNIFIVFSF